MSNTFSDFRFEDKIDKSKTSKSNFKRSVCEMFYRNLQ